MSSKLRGNGGVTRRIFVVSGDPTVITNQPWMSGQAGSQSEYLSLCLWILVSVSMNVFILSRSMWLCIISWKAHLTKWYLWSSSYWVSFWFLQFQTPDPTQIILPKGHSHPNQTKAIHPGTHGQDKGDQLTNWREDLIWEICVAGQWRLWTWNSHILESQPAN